MNRDLQDKFVLRARELLTNIKSCRSSEDGKEETCYRGRFLLGGVTFKMTSEKEDERPLLYNVSGTELLQGYDIKYAPVHLSVSHSGELFTLYASLVPAEGILSQIFTKPAEKGETKEDWFLRLGVLESRLNTGINLWTKDLRFWFGADGKISVLIPSSKLSLENPILKAFKDSVNPGDKEKLGHKLEESFEKTRFIWSVKPMITMATRNIGWGEFKVGLGGFYESNEIDTTDSGKMLPVSLKHPETEFPVEHYGAANKLAAQFDLSSRVGLDITADGYFGTKKGFNSKTLLNFSLPGNNEIGLFFKTSFIQYGANECKITDFNLGGGIEGVLGW